MKFQEKLPLPLDKITDDLDELGVSAMVHQAKVEYDTRKLGTDVTLTLVIRIEDIYKERRTLEDKFNDAMDII